MLVETVRPVRSRAVTVTVFSPGTRATFDDRNVPVVSLSVLTLTVASAMAIVSGSTFDQPPLTSIRLLPTIIGVAGEVMVRLGASFKYRTRREALALRPAALCPRAAITLRPGLRR